MMKIVRLLLLLILFGSSLTLKAQTEFKVITFNVRSFEPNFDVKPYAQHLADEDADFICLNEVENRSTRQMVNNQYRDVVQDIANELQLFGTFGYSYNLNNKQEQDDESKYTYCRDELYGNAILSRYPILNTTALRLPRPEGSADQRSVLIADILLPTGNTIRVACTHLDHKGGQKEQAAVLVSKDVLSQTIPTVLTGDMNEWPGTEVIRNICYSYDRMDTDAATYRSGSKIDFIFGSKDKWELISSRVLDRFHDEQELSDHSPVVSVIRLK